MNKNVKKYHSPKYGEQLFLESDMRINYTKNDQSIRIMIKGLKPVYVPKDSAMYKSLIKNFEEEN